LRKSSLRARAGPLPMSALAKTLAKKADLVEVDLEAGEVMDAGEFTEVLQKVKDTHRIKP